MRKVALVFILPLSACAASSGIQPLRPYEIATAPYLEGGSESVVGSLMYEGGCLLFDPESGPPRLLPIWPDGTRFEQSLVTFHQPAKADQRIAIGEEIRLDGRTADWSRLDPHVYGRFEQQCGAKPFFVSGLAPAN
jgi:hypothetical protein